jgi:CTP:phosphocholine cytidylyltransferase-like protein
LEVNHIVKNNKVSKGDTYITMYDSNEYHAQIGKTSMFKIVSVNARARKANMGMSFRLNRRCEKVKGI